MHGWESAQDSRCRRLVGQVVRRAGLATLARENLRTATDRVATFIWLMAFGVPYPLLLAIFVAVLDLVLFVGSTIAGVVVAAVAFTASPRGRLPRRTRWR